MKKLFAAGAASMFILAGTAYADGQYYHHDDCDDCSDTMTIDISGEIECVCEFTLTDHLTFSLGELSSDLLSTPQNFVVVCNSDDPMISATSLYGGLKRVGGSETINYDLILSGTSPNAEYANGVIALQTYDTGHTAAAIRLATFNHNLLPWGTYEDTITITIAGQ